MAETSLITKNDLERMPRDARKKWLQALLQEKKSATFGLKQQLDKLEQDILDIRDGKINKVKYSMIMTLKQIDEIEAVLKEVDVVDLT